MTSVQPARFLMVVREAAAWPGCLPLVGLPVQFGDVLVSGLGEQLRVHDHGPSGSYG